jgi:hypothetical protein
VPQGAGHDVPNVVGYRYEITDARLGWVFDTGCGLPQCLGHGLVDPSHVLKPQRELLSHLLTVTDP